MCDILLATRQVSVHSRRTRSITSMDAARSISPVQSRSIAANGAAGQSQLTLPVPGSQNSASGAAFRRSSLSESNQRVSRLKAEISAREKDDLEIIKGDVCEWLGKTLEIEISADSFMDTLDTGVVLCKLARLIQDKARSAKEAGDKVSVAIPMETVKCQFRAIKGSFFARDNSANFIKWCKKLGVNEEVMFESNGLVQQEDEKRVILCLIDVSRYGQKVHIKPPELVRLENEIDMLEMGEAEDSVFDEQPAAVTPPLCKRTTVHIIKDSSSTSSSVSSQRSSSSESAVVDDCVVTNEAQQSQEPSKQLAVKIDQKSEKKVAVADLNPVSTMDQSPKPVADQPRTESPIPIPKEKTTKKKVAQKSPRRSPHRSPHRRSPNRSQPRHCKEQQEPPQCHTTKRQQQPAKKEEPPSEEKTDELVRTLPCTKRGIQKLPCTSTVGGFRNLFKIICS